MWVSISPQAGQTHKGQKLLGYREQNLKQFCCLVWQQNLIYNVCHYFHTRICFRKHITRAQNIPLSTREN